MAEGQITWVSVDGKVWHRPLVEREAWHKGAVDLCHCGAEVKVGAVWFFGDQAGPWFDDEEEEGENGEVCLDCAALAAQPFGTAEQLNNHITKQHRRLR